MNRGADALPAGAGPTSLWTGARTVTARLLRRLVMPLGWAVALLLCAGSAFAVRDVLFPSLGESSARSVWEPRPSAGGEPAPIRSTTSAERPTAAAPAGVVIETIDEPSSSIATSVSVASPRRTDRVSGRGGRSSGVVAPTGNGSGTGSGTGGISADDPADVASNSPVPSPGTTAGGGRHGDDSTVTSTPTAPGVTTTTAGPVTTTTDAGVTTTISATTGDTIADQTGRRGSGPGGGGGSDDNLS
ncbi:MAG: hypothetical protein ACOYMR_12550 [Ilumatobacteraceae bacterium]